MIDKKELKNGFNTGGKNVDMKNTISKDAINQIKNIKQEEEKIEKKNK